VDTWNDFAQQFDLLSGEISDLDRQPGDIPTWPRKAA
jgi:hypothetical protein